MPLDDGAVVSHHLFPNRSVFGLVAFVFSCLFSATSFNSSSTFSSSLVFSRSSMSFLASSSSSNQYRPPRTLSLAQNLLLNLLLLLDLATRRLLNRCLLCRRRACPCCERCVVSCRPEVHHRRRLEVHHRCLGVHHRIMGVHRLQLCHHRLPHFHSKILRSVLSGVWARLP